MDRTYPALPGPGRVYVSDTNIWIDLGNVGLLEATFQLPHSFASTDFVLNELPPRDRRRLQALGLDIVVMGGDQMSLLQALAVQHNNSSLADVSCYLLARRNGHALLTGDGRLRRRAASEGIPVHGVLWILDQLIACGIVTAAGAAAGLQAMLAAGARLPEADCRHRLAAWRT